MLESEVVLFGLRFHKHKIAFPELAEPNTPLEFWKSEHFLHTEMYLRQHSGAWQAEIRLPSYEVFMGYNPRKTAEAVASAPEDAVRRALESLWLADGLKGLSKQKLREHFSDLGITLE